jgi:cob(I)alamin adenosyltransferase
MQHRFHIYIGDGKGKTTAAIGLAVRALGAGLRVAFLQFDKEESGSSERYHERRILRSLPGIDLFAFGNTRVLGLREFRFENNAGDFEEARRGLERAEQMLVDGSYDLVILDEILAAVHTHLLEPRDVTRLVDVYDRERKCELVMTGHAMWPEIEQRADLVTEMRKGRHYFDKGIPAKKGIEY